MQVDPRFQRQGVGKRILQRFTSLLEEKAISESYCLAYAHLENFYGTIGFKKIEGSEAPMFLQERLVEGGRMQPDKPFILMIRQSL
jgi:N-acetylglutamate synthase-like GNAT family acetyltransferase